MTSACSLSSRTSVKEWSPAMSMMNLNLIKHAIPEGGCINVPSTNPQGQRIAKADLPPHPPQGSPPASQASEKNERYRLRAELDRLQNEKHDLQIALLTSNEHGDSLQEHFYRLSAS